MWLSKKGCVLRFLFTVVAFAEAQVMPGGPPDLSPEELRYIASLNLCRHFGGSCGVGCDRFIVHKWRLPLCDQDRKCCIPETAYQGAKVHQETTVMTTTESTTTTTPPPTTTTTTTTTTTPTPELPQSAESTQWMEYPADLDNTLNDPGTVSSDSGPDTQFLGPDLDQCGSMEWARRRKRIVGGSVSPPGAWPWLLAIRSSVVGAHACSGALIAQRWVVTAAHCFRHFSMPGAWRMRVGEQNLLTDDGTERDISIANIFIYPGYQTRRGENATLYARYKHDLALVQLADDAGVEPVCLPTGPAADPDPEMMNASDESNMASRFRHTLLESRGDCWVSGWGFTRDDASTDQVMRQVQGEVVSSEDCSEMWGTQLDNDMICFGDGTRGPCAGDSGGPLSCNLDGRWYLGGVVSWGTEDCNVSGYPAVFTRLSPYLPWITATIQEQQQQQQ